MVRGNDVSVGGLRPIVLLVDNDAASQLALRQLLTRNSYRVAATDDGGEALLLARDEKPDLVILDWPLPTISGLEVCRQLRSRKETRNVPIIMVSARSTEDDRIRALDTGADDYVLKPFSEVELMARITALFRRVRPRLVAPVIQEGKLEMHREELRVRFEGSEVSLGPTEYRLLEFFLQYPGRVFSRQQLLDSVWGTDADIEVRTVDVFVGRVRRALEAVGATGLIRTVRAGGYSFG